MAGGVLLAADPDNAPVSTTIAFLAASRQLARASHELCGKKTNSDMTACCNSATHGFALSRSQLARAFAAKLGIAAVRATLTGRRPTHGAHRHCTLTHQSGSCSQYEKTLAALDPNCEATAACREDIRQKLAALRAVRRQSAMQKRKRQQDRAPGAHPPARVRAKTATGEKLFLYR